MIFTSGETEIKLLPCQGVATSTPIVGSGSVKLVANFNIEVYHEAPCRRPSTAERFGQYRVTEEISRDGSNISGGHSVLGASTSSFTWS
jgi:hypothetical protein